ncbi:MAG TPA: hypothetical protein PLL06_23210, partial [Acidobacteriota bacterium]|nr:hypothetical protein [Acidobacteriota bacterium]
IFLTGCQPSFSTIQPRPIVLKPAQSKPINPDQKVLNLAAAKQTLLSMKGDLQANQAKAIQSLANKIAEREQLETDAKVYITQNPEVLLLLAIAKVAVDAKSNQSATETEQVTASVVQVLLASGLWFTAVGQEVMDNLAKFDTAFKANDIAQRSLRAQLSDFNHQLALIETQIKEIEQELHQ